MGFQYSHNSYNNIKVWFKEGFQLVDSLLREYVLCAEARKAAQKPVSVVKQKPRDSCIVGMSDIRTHSKCTDEKGRTEFQGRGYVCSALQRTVFPSSSVHTKL